MALPLPETLPELSHNKQYSWHMMLLCEDLIGPDAPVISGGVKRVSLDSSVVGVESLPLPEQAEVYSELGLWYDLIATLTQMQSENPEDVQTQKTWEELLRSVGLDSLFDESLQAAS